MNTTPTATPATAPAPRRLIGLHGRHSSAFIEWAADEAPLWRYWGPRLPEGCDPGPMLRDTRPVPPSSLEHEQPLSLVPTFGVGWFGQPALLAHRLAGSSDTPHGAQHLAQPVAQHFAQHFQHCEILSETPGQALQLRLTDPVAQLALTLQLSLDADDVLRLQSRLHNLGASVLQLQWLAAGTLALPAACREVRSFRGQWATEFQWEHTPLGQSQWLRENRRGRTSHDSFPGAVVLEAGTTAHAGAAYGAHLAWSGNHRQCIDALGEGGWQWQLGEWLAPGEGLLAPGQHLDSPTLLAAFSPHGCNGLAACFHAATRAALPWPGGQMRPRPVHLNTWEAIYFHHNEAELRELAEAAAAVGVERFVLDDGWFPARHHDRAGLGDWWPDPAKYPQGLGPLAAHVNALGMEFGLWVEPEMVNPDSQLYRQHPEWVLQLPGQPLLTARNQLVLDVARPEVAQYLFERLDALLSSLPIAYLKWDMNRDLTTAGDRRGAPAYRVQVQALYALLDRVRAAHPAVEIESCSSGGARVDLGVLAHSHRVWTSDCNDARSRLGIQRGALQFFPPEVLGAHIGPAPSHTTGRAQSLDYRAAVALPLHLGVEADVRRLDPEERQRLARWITLYKQLRGRLHGRPVHVSEGLGEGGDGIVWQAHGDAHDSLLFIYRTEPTQQRWSPALRLPWLDAQRRYRVRRVDTTIQPGLPGWGSSPLHEALGTEQGQLLDGAWLRHAGLPLPRLTGESHLILELLAV